MSWDEDELAELDALRDEEALEAFPPLPVLICRCHCVEERELEALAAAGCDLAEIAKRTGATTHCGSCRAQVEAIVSAARGDRPPES
jgi:bacterioferritin-associated ferredoxin